MRPGSTLASPPAVLDSSASAPAPDARVSPEQREQGATEASRRERQVRRPAPGDIGSRSGGRSVISRMCCSSSFYPIDVPSNFRSFISGELRPPTSLEREVQRELRERGVADVYLDVQSTPDEWWEVAVLLTHELVLQEKASPAWDAWLQEWRFRTGWRPTHFAGARTYADLVGSGYVSTGRGTSRYYEEHTRLAAIETLLDLQEPAEDFAEYLNERARWFRVGLRLEGKRFIPIKGEHLHAEVVQPTLLLLAEQRFEQVDALYRKAFDRYLQNDPSGSITAATSAVEEMLRIGLRLEGLELGRLCDRANNARWITPAIAETAKKLHALRNDSDAHTAGTDKAELAMFALHIAGSVLLYLGDTIPQG